ncbi:MAG: CHASE2 domain-containing protein, partial [Kamptonema sp. SIO4C4]|nr:CHASE2 domain-containing protein [Kamptonema sp. SIO4C4]
MMQDVKSWLSQWVGIGVVTPLVTLVVLGVRGLGLLQPWELGLYDLYLRLRPALPPDDRIVIVGINEADIRQYDTSILPDRVYAELIEKLQQMQPRVIGFDIYRDVSPNSEEQTLQKIFQDSDNLIGITKVIGNADTETVDAPEILREKGQIGANDVIAEADGRVRRGFLSINLPNRPEIPGFGVHLALRYLEAEGQLQPAKAPNAEEDWHLRPDDFPRFRSNTGGYVGAKAGGYQILINYRGGTEAFKQVSLTDILEDRVPPEWGRDRIILIGAVSESFNDLFLTPYSGGITRVPKPIPGVVIQAHLASQVLSTVLDGRPPLRTLPDPLEWLWTALWAGVGAGLTWKYRYGIEARSQKQGKWTKFATLSRIMIALAAVGTLVGSAYF